MRELFFGMCWYIKFRILIALGYIINEKKYPKHFNKLFDSVEKEIARDNVSEKYRDLFKRTRKDMIEKLM